MRRLSSKFALLPLSLCAGFATIALGQDPVVEQTPSSTVPTAAPSPMVTTAAPPAPSKAKPLDFKKIKFITGPQELSGLAIINGKLRMVADKKTDTFIYELKDQPDGRLKVIEGRDYKKAVGFKIYTKHIPQDRNNKVKATSQDFEGMAVCGNSIFVVDERVRNVLKFRTDGGFERLPIVFSTVKGLYDGGDNAGFEGIAADCDKKILYVAKERQPRFLLKIEMKKWKILEQTDVYDPGVPNPVARGTWVNESPFDFSDLAFDRGFLYALSRNEREIMKIDPQSFRVVDRRSYGHIENSLFDTGEPYGISEALVMQPDEIIIGIDNNGKPISKDAAAKYNVSGNFGAVMYFKRPPGF